MKNCGWAPPTPIILSAVEKPHAFPLRYSPLNGEMSALALTEGSVCASKRCHEVTDEVFCLFPLVAQPNRHKMNCDKSRELPLALIAFRHFGLLAQALKQWYKKGRRERRPVIIKCECVARQLATRNAQRATFIIVALWCTPCQVQF